MRYWAIIGPEIDPRSGPSRPVDSGPLRKNCDIVGTSALLLRLCKVFGPPILMTRVFPLRPPVNSILVPRPKPPVRVRSGPEFGGRLPLSNRWCKPRRKLSIPAGYSSSKPPGICCWYSRGSSSGFSIFSTKVPLHDAQCGSGTMSGRISA